jgi:hypothetical protein
VAHLGMVLAVIHVVLHARPAKQQQIRLRRMEKGWRARGVMGEGVGGGGGGPLKAQLILSCFWALLSQGLGREANHVLNLPFSKHTLLSKL